MGSSASCGSRDGGAASSFITIDDIPTSTEARLAAVKHGVVGAVGFRAVGSDIWDGDGTYRQNV